jgi:hypothetical protein
MDIICNYNSKANIYSFYSFEVERTFTCDSKGNRNPALGNHCLKWEHTKDIPEAAYLAAKEFFANLLAQQQASSLMTAWKRGSF